MFALPGRVVAPSESEVPRRHAIGRVLGPVGPEQLACAGCARGSTSNPVGVDQSDPSLFIDWRKDDVRRR